MHLEKDLTGTFRLEHSSDLVTLVFSWENILVQGKRVNVCVDVPTPVVEAADVPTGIAPPIEEENFAEEGPDAPGVGFILIGSHGCQLFSQVG
jgi:hypothetical protein